MITLVIDASIAVKWVVGEEGAEAAAAIRHGARFVAPDLLLPECANILWKKAQRSELSKDEALLAARLLMVADIELVSARALLEPATRIAIELQHPAYDCVYLALAESRGCRMVTADERWLRRLARDDAAAYRERAISLADAAATSGAPRA